MKRIIRKVREAAPSLHSEISRESMAEPAREAGGASAGADTAVERVIAEHPFLKGMKKEHLQVLAANAMRVQHAPGTLIFRQGDPANRFYLIEQGTVSLETSHDGTGSARLQTIGAGDVLGWSWLFPPFYWQFDARVLEPVTAIFFYGTRLREACEEDHDLGYELIRRMAAVVIDRLQTVRRRLLEVRSQWIREPRAKEALTGCGRANSK